MLWIGDSLTRDAALGTWAQRGAGKTAEDQAITNWMHAGQSPQSVDSIDGFALATPYFCSARSYTVGDGLGAWHFMGSSSMPADNNPATARQKLQDCATYPNALNLFTMLAALPKAQFAIPEVNLEASNPAVFTDLERMIDLMISRGIVPIIITYTYRTDAAFNLLVDRYNTALVAYAQAKRLPLIDLNKEMLARLPFSLWPGRFLSDGTHYTRGTTANPATSDPYAQGGDPATHTTGLALTFNGYGLKGWLGVQKMKEIKQLVIDGVSPALPTVTLSASPTSITSGASSTLTWTSTNATTVSINQGIGTVAASGTRSVSPTSTTTYTITATNAAGSVTDTATVTVTAAPALPTVTLNASPTSITSGASSTLTWSSTNATSLSINQGIGTVAASGTRSVSPTSTTTYTVTATNATGSVTDTATVTVTSPSDTTPPTVSGITPMAGVTGVSLAATVRVTFNETMNPATLTNSTMVLRNAANAVVPATVSYDAPFRTGVITPSSPLSGSTTYTATITGVQDVAGNALAAPYVSSFTTAAAPALPTVTLSASPTSITSGASSTLTWSSTNATTLSINQGIGTVAASGTRSVSPTSTTTYTITATNGTGSVTATATVTVTAAPPLPTVTLNASPTSITSGASSTLTWSSTNATTVSINQGIGTVAASGTRSVSPTSTTTYTITATNATGSRTATATVTVTAAPVTVTADTVTPSSGTGASQTFTARYSDTAGATDLSMAWLWVTPSTTAPSTNSCLVYYDPGTNGLSLLNDAGTAYTVAALGSAGTLQNSQCAVALGGSSRTLSGNTLTLNVALTFTAAFSGVKNLVLYAANAGGVNSGWQSRGTWTVPSGSGATSVTADSVAPASGTGASQTFALRYSDTAGATDLSMVWAWVTPSQTSPSTNSCLVYYDRVTNALALLNDAGTAYMGAPVGSAGPLQNSQCRVTMGSSTTVTLSGNTLTLNLALTFTPAFGGAKNLVMYASNAAAVNSGWQSRGTWTVPTTTRTTPTLTWPAPAPINFGTALSGTQLNATANVPGTFAYSPPAGTVLPPGAGQTLSVTFTPTDLANYTTATASVAITVTGSSGTVVTADTVTPASGTGASQTFTARYSDTAGATDLSMAWLWVTPSTTAPSTNSCLLDYDPGTNGLSLLNDAGTAYTVAALGSAGTLQNSQCAVALGGSSRTLSGNTLTLNLALTFTPAFNGVKNLVLYAANAGGVNSGWQSRGTWTVPSGSGATAVTADMVTPASGTGTSQTFALRYSDTAGATDLSMVWLWVTPSQASPSTNSCLVYYDRGTNTLALLNDSGTAYLGAPGGQCRHAAEQPMPGDAGQQHDRDGERQHVDAEPGADLHAGVRRREESRHVCVERGRRQQRLAVARHLDGAVGADSSVVQAFRPAGNGGPEGPHYIWVKERRT